VSAVVAIVLVVTVLVRPPRRRWARGALPARGRPLTSLSPQARKLTLTVRVTSSVGWIGAVATLLALAIAGLTHSDALTIRACYVAMDLITWYVIVPASFAALVTSSSRSGLSGG
jgi:hypothetical protein